MKINLKYMIINIVIFSHFLLFTPLSYAKTDVTKTITTCNTCHGEKGIAVIKQYPNLAGQKKGYLFAQLKAFKSGVRDNAIMAQQLENVSEDQMQEISKYYASLSFVKHKDKNINQAGKNIRANCISCHGMTGKTVNDTWPNLAGQNSEYLLQQLKDFSSGKRKSMIMNVIASELNDQQMIDVAEYYQQTASKY
ncbi:c-type cytochrome [Pseudocolwellia sp. HL-MZ19]|uniref:c-type cytochrome n=1 Tax=Pseudocolwellia sp. HL-MZ19 TaxID=3400846 RepID=UPI003CEFD1EC